MEGRGKSWQEETVEPCFMAVVPSLFGAQGVVSRKTIFPQTGGSEEAGSCSYVSNGGVMGSGRWSFTCLPTAHLLYSPVSNRPRTGTGLWSMVGTPAL